MISAWAPLHDTYRRAALSHIALWTRLPPQTSCYSEPYTTNSLCARTPTRHPHAVKTIMSKRTDQITTPRPGRRRIAERPPVRVMQGRWQGCISHPSGPSPFPRCFPSLISPDPLAEHVRSCSKLQLMYILSVYFYYVIHYGALFSRNGWQHRLKSQTVSSLDIFLVRSREREGDSFLHTVPLTLSSFTLLCYISMLRLLWW